MITHTQRLKAVKEGRILDRPAYTAWGPHMSLVDRNVKDFTEATIAYQNSYQFDFIKLMSNGMYFTEDATCWRRFWAEDKACSTYYG